MVFTNRNTFIYFIPIKKLRGPSTILRQAQQPAQGPIWGLVYADFGLFDKFRDRLKEVKKGDE